MPLPLYKPGTGNLGEAQPILDSMGGFYNKGAEMINHPMNALSGMLGMSTQDPSQADPSMVDQANKTFIHPTPNPVVAPPRRKSMQGTTRLGQ